MTRLVISLAVLLTGTNAYAKLEIVNIQAAYGEVGPARSSLVYYPGDEILFKAADRCCARIRLGRFRLVLGEQGFNCSHGRHRVSSFIC